MKAYYTQETWKNENYRFFRWKAWLKALDMTVKTSKKEVRIEKKENARRAA